MHVLVRELFFPTKSLPYTPQKLGDDYYAIAYTHEIRHDHVTYPFLVFFKSIPREHHLPPNPRNLLPTSKPNQRILSEIY